MRSSMVSPIPIRIPVVKAMESLPASSMVRRRSAGTLSGALACGKPSRIRRGLTFSSIKPTLAFDFQTFQGGAIHHAGLACGSNPVFSRTNSDMAAR